jgi:uncharacterized membrane protein
MAIQHIDQDRAQHLLPAPTRHGSMQKPVRIIYRFGDFIIEQWATIITIILGVLISMAISVPFLFYFGLNTLAQPIFFALHAICAQIPSHSFYVFGHQLGFCERNLSIYTAMFIGSLIFVLSKKRLPGIPWWVWLLMILPMAWDGFTQMFGLRESTWVLRVITGSLFGFANIWFVFPLMHKTLQEPPTPPLPVPRRISKVAAHSIHPSGIERIAMAIRSVLPASKQYKGSNYSAHTLSISRHDVARNSAMHNQYPEE